MSLRREVEVSALGTLRPIKTVPLTSIRGIVSERMATSSRATARVTLFRTVDVTALIDLRQRFKAQEIQVSYNDILVRICATALREHPDAATQRIEFLLFIELHHLLVELLWLFFVLLLQRFKLRLEGLHFGHLTVVLP